MVKVVERKQVTHKPLNPKQKRLIRKLIYGDFDEMVYELQGTSLEWIIDEANYDYDEIIYTMQDLLR